jgi:hypothetical protein
VVRVVLCQGPAERETPRARPPVAPGAQPGWPFGRGAPGGGLCSLAPSRSEVLGRSAEGAVEPPRHGGSRRPDGCRRRRACALRPRRQSERAADVGGGWHSPRDRLRVRAGVDPPRPPGVPPRQGNSSSPPADRGALETIDGPGGASVQALDWQERAAPAPMERPGGLIRVRRRCPIGWSADTTPCWRPPADEDPERPGSRRIGPGASIAD